MDHITSELMKLTDHDKYAVNELVRTASGVGMEISHIGHSIFCPPTHEIHRNNLLHVPKASKNLISINCLARDNNAFLEFYPGHFVIKEQGMKRTLLRCEGGLYPLKPLPNKQVLTVTKLSTSVWHYRLGHAFTPVVQKVLSGRKLALLKIQIRM